MLDGPCLLVDVLLEIDENCTLCVKNRRTLELQKQIDISQDLGSSSWSMDPQIGPISTGTPQKKTREKVVDSSHLRKPTLQRERIDISAFKSNIFEDDVPNFPESVIC